LENNQAYSNNVVKAGKYAAAALEFLGMAAVSAIKTSGKGLSKLGNSLEKPVKKAPKAVGRAFTSCFLAINSGAQQLAKSFYSSPYKKTRPDKPEKIQSVSLDIRELSSAVETLIVEKRLLAQRTAALEKRLVAIESVLYHDRDDFKHLKPEIKELKKDLIDISESLKA